MTLSKAAILFDEITTSRCAAQLRPRTMGSCRNLNEPTDRANTQEDSELLLLHSAIVNRDQSALSRLYDLTVSRVYNLAFAIIGNKHDAEEVVGDVYYRAWENAAQYNPGRGPIIAWLMINCRYLALDCIRRQRAQLSGKDKVLVRGMPVNDEISTEDLIQLLQEGSAVRRAIVKLSSIQQRLVTLAFFKDMTHSEIAVAVNLPLGTVKSHLRRGLQKLRECIEL